jgi:hypothetical protein
LPYIKPSEKNELERSATAIRAIGFMPSAPLLTTMAQETAYFILARYAIMYNNINYITGDY